MDAMNPGDRTNLDISPEMCCEACGETIHNHFNCPVCGRRGVGTSMYGSMYEEVREWGSVAFNCEACGAIFDLVAESAKQKTWLDEWTWTYVGKRALLR